MVLADKMLKIKKNSILVFILLLPHLRPESLAYVAPFINKLYNVGRVMSFIILICIMIYRKKKPSQITIAIFLLELWVVFTTYLNHGDMQRASVNMMSSISLMLIVDLYAKKNIIGPVLCNFVLLIYVNLITVVFLPNGLYQTGVHKEFIDFFLGFKNSFYPYCIVTIFLSGLYYIQSQKNRLESICVMIASFLNVFLAWSASSIVAISVSLMMFILIVVIRRPRFLRKLKFKTLFISYIIVDILVCVVNFVENVPFVANFVTNVLHKQTDLSGRTYIWGLALKAIREQPFIGYGIGEHINWRGYNWYGHNQIFEMLMEGGIPCLLVFLIIIFMVSRKMDQCHNRIVYSMMIAVFSGIFVFYIAEAGVSPVFYLVFAFAYHINDIVSYNGIDRIARLIQGHNRK